MLYQPQDVQPPLAPASGLDAPHSNVIAFTARVETGTLSLRDRMEIASWQGELQAHGCDRMVIQERTSCDPPEVGAFLSIYRSGEAWARWNLARCGGSILAWCSVSGRDIGRFPSMEDAFGALFPVASPRRGQRASAEVIRAFC